jgi:uncharacterized protein
MALEMKTACEKCGGAIANDQFAFICSYECTFCSACTQSMDYTCPNCGGELVTRPRRFPKSI